MVPTAALPPAAQFPALESGTERPGAWGAGYTAEDFDHSPFVVLYEVTRACDLKCRHCRATAQPHPHPGELQREDSLRLLEQLTEFPKRPVLVLSGGDPMKRRDIFDLILHGRRLGLTMAMSISATPLVTPAALEQMRRCGISRLAVSLDAVDAPTHDSFRGFEGSFQRTLHIIHHAEAVGLPVQINTTLTRKNVHQVDAMAAMLARMNILLWSVFFLVPVGRGITEQRISPEQYEEVFEKLFRQSLRQPYGIKTADAHHYRRFVLKRQEMGQHQPLHSLSESLPEAIPRTALGINDGKGVMYVSHTGAVSPSGFMPIHCGQFPRQSVVSIYQGSAVFQALRDPGQLQGKCGYCEFKEICGGSRARAYAVTRDPLAADPDCNYQPETWRIGDGGSATRLRSQ